MSETLVWLYIYIYIYIYIYVCVCVCVRACAHVCARACLSVCLSIYLCLVRCLSIYLRSWLSIQYIIFIYLKPAQNIIFCLVIKIGATFLRIKMAQCQSNIPIINIYLLQKHSLIISTLFSKLVYLYSACKYLIKYL